MNITTDVAVEIANRDWTKQQILEALCWHPCFMLTAADLSDDMAAAKAAGKVIDPADACLLGMAIAITLVRAADRSDEDNLGGGAHRC